ncbi:hypothetical protein IE53DRAFT_365390, partial [Violaceomyces palustris]
MFSLEPLLLTLPLLGLASAVRDPSFPACDVEPNSCHTHKSGSGFPWQATRESDDKVDYLAPGMSACGEVYKDTDPVVCLKPGWVNSAYSNGCDKWVTVEYNGKRVEGRVLDSCGALKDTTFGCNDIYLSLYLFEELGGNKTLGYLEGPVGWSFIEETCWGCQAGYNGTLPDGSGQTNCDSGVDYLGYERQGRRYGSDILSIEEAKKTCGDNNGGGGGGSSSSGQTN